MTSVFLLDVSFNVEVLQERIFTIVRCRLVGLLTETTIITCGSLLVEFLWQASHTLDAQAELVKGINC